jgi:hypothetical protein
VGAVKFADADAEAVCVEGDKDESEEAKYFECNTNGRPQDAKFITWEDVLRAAACKRPQLIYVVVSKTAGYV